MPHHGAGPALLKVMCQSTEVMDLGDSRRGVDKVEPGLAERADVEPATVRTGLAARFPDRVIQVEKEETPGIVTPGEPGSRSLTGDDSFMLPPAPAAVNAKDPAAGLRWRGERRGADPSTFTPCPCSRAAVAPSLGRSGTSSIRVSSPPSVQPSVQLAGPPAERDCAGSA